jgi:acyl dehydratase
MPGLTFEDFEVGKRYEHDGGRSVTQFDNIWYSRMTLNTQPLHSNLDFAERNGLYGKPLFNSMYTLSIVIGQSSAALTHGTLLDVIGLEDIEFPKPTFADDTLYSRTTVTAVRASPESDESGEVEFFHEGINQRQETIMSCRRTVLVRRRRASAS